MERSCWWGMGTGYNHLMRMQNFAAHFDEKMMQGEVTSLIIDLKHGIELAAVPWVEIVQIGHYSHRLLLLQGPSRMKMTVSTDCNEWEGMIPRCFAPKFACLCLSSAEVVPSYTSLAVGLIHFPCMTCVFGDCPLCITIKHLASWVLMSIGGVLNIFN